MDKANNNPLIVDSDKVISLSRFTSGQSLSPIRQAEAYWTALRDGNSIPKRSDVDPRGLENLLHCSFIVESVAPGVARFRLAGRQIAEITGMEVRGMPLTALFTPLSRNAVSAALTEVFEMPAIAEFVLSSETRIARPQFEAHMVLLPLKDDFDRVTRSLGVIVADTKNNPNPVRFDIVGKTARPVSGPMYETQSDPIRTPAKTPGLAEPDTHFERKAPHLRLVKSGD